jgi:hypothetical protein
LHPVMVRAPPAMRPVTLTNANTLFSLPFSNAVLLSLTTLASGTRAAGQPRAFLVAAQMPAPRCVSGSREPLRPPAAAGHLSLIPA